MSEDQNPVLLTDAPDETPKPARRKAPARASRKKADPAEPAAVEAVPATPKPKRAPRKPKAKPAEAVPAPETVPSPVTADLFDAPPAPEAAVTPAPAPEAPALLAPEPSPVVSEEAAPAVVASAEAVLPASRRKRKRRRGRTERAGSAGPAAAETTSLDETPPAAPALAEVEPDATAAPAAEPVAAPAELVEAAEESAEPAPLAPLTVVSLGLDTPPALSAEALAVLKGAQIVLGSADALDRLAALGLALPQALCAPESVHLDLRRIGHAGSVLVVVGDAAGDGPAAELLAELGPGQVRVLPGVGRVQAACAALGLSPDVVSVVDLRRSPLAALRGQLRAHRLFAVPLADAAAPVAVARLLVDSGFAGARVWVCEFAGGELQARAWLATELAELRESFEPRAVLIVATGPSAGLFAELPGIAPESLGDAAHAALPLAARLLALAWLQPAAWETGWAISDGEASLALEWARAVPTARLRAVGVDPSLLGVVMARAGVGENLAAIPAASPLRCREWPAPEAVFVRGGVGLSEWLAAAWARLAPGGRLVATAEDDNARADLLAFPPEVPAEAWQEPALASGEPVAGRLRFAPAAPVRLALWRKPLET
ncbi:SAM-dependent methyltransferase [Zoogloea ramigera]|uniref:SAM-dependent methyltransferase n=1 Tax=Zoogloea ramigera TaxID=350 RepID=UPI003FA2AE36